MRILMLVFNQTGKGTYWRAWHFARTMVRWNHQVSLGTTSPTNRWHAETKKVEGVDLVEFPDWMPGSLRSGWDGWNTLTRLRWLKGKHFDIVHAFEARPVVLVPALAAARSGAHLVMDWADWFGRGGSVEERPNPFVRTILRPVETFFEERFRTRAEATTVICSELGRKAATLGVDPKTIFLIPNGCSPENFPKITAKQAREKTGLPQEGLWIGYVGSAFLNDAILMAESFNLVCESFPQARLLLVGYFTHDLHRMVKYPDRILQTGPLPYETMVQYLTSCDLFWLPLRDTNANRGRWPLKINDYMAAGRPIVATAVGDIKELMQENSIGLLSADAPLPFAEQTLRLVENQELCDRIGLAGRQLAETSYHWDTLSRNLESLYLRTSQE